MLKFAGGAATLGMIKMRKEHSGQMYFAFTAGFVKFRSAAKAPRAKSELAGAYEGHFGHFGLLPLQEVN